VGDVGGSQPIVNGPLNPRWHRNRSNVTAFSYEINDGPVILATLEVINREFRQFATPQTATQ
jgi:hypothetical protein